MRCVRWQESIHSCCKPAYPGRCIDYHLIRCAHRDPLYDKVKTELWDFFPQWEDLYYDAAFKEMLWASEGGVCPFCRLIAWLQGHACMTAMQ